MRERTALATAVAQLQDVQEMLAVQCAELHLTKKALSRHACRAEDATRLLIQSQKASRRSDHALLAHSLLGCPCACVLRLSLHACHFAGARHSTGVARLGFAFGSLHSAKRRRTVSRSTIARLREVHSGPLLL
jgi:hypothetical protein